MTRMKTASGEVHSIVVSSAHSGHQRLVENTESGKAIRVHQLFLVAGGTVDVYLRDEDGNAIVADSTNPIPLDKTGITAPSGFVLNESLMGWGQTANGKDLQINLSAAVAVSGVLVYSLVE